MANKLDRSKLHEEVHINKKGQLVKKLVSNKKDTIKKQRTPQWYDKFSGIGLTRLPVGIDEKDVVVHVDIKNPDEYNSKCVLSWVDPKTNKQIRIYTKEFLNRNAQVKWARISEFKEDLLDEIKEKCTNELLDKNSDKFKQAAAIISIIANTGLRVGQTKGLEETGNKGVSTISPDDITIDSKNNIKLNFVGKSYKENNALIENQPLLAKYLKKLKQSKQGKDRLFDIDRTFADAVFKNRFGFKELKLKDMRTYVATSLAKQHLYNDIDEVKDMLTGDDKKDVKLINKRLQSTYIFVSDKLNNTPKMAETAYVHPNIRTEWLKDIGFHKELTKSIDNMEFVNKDIPYIDEFDEEMCDEYNLFDFEHSFNDELQKSKHLAIVNVTNRNGKQYQRTQLVGSDKNPMNSKHFELHKHGEDYDKHLLSLVKVKSNRIASDEHGNLKKDGDKYINEEYTHYVKPSAMVGIKYNDRNQDSGIEEFNGFESFDLHPDEEHYRQHLIDNSDSEAHELYSDKISNSYKTHNNGGLGDVKPKDVQSSNKFRNITKELYNSQNKSSDELHIEHNTDKGVKLIEQQKKNEEDEKNAKIQQEQESRRKYNEESYNKTLYKLKSFFNTLSNHDIGDMSVKDFYYKIFKETNLQLKISGMNPHPIDKNTPIEVEWKDKPASKGNMGQLITYLRNKKDTNGNMKLPFTSMKILEYNENNPYSDRESHDFD